MDPNAALLLLLEAFDENNREEAEVRLNDLGEWITRGGYLPTVHVVLKSYLAE